MKGNKKAKTRQNYLNRVIKEFNSKGWDTSVIYGRKRTDKGLLKNEKTYKELKDNVRKARYLYKAKEEYESKGWSLEKLYGSFKNDKNILKHYDDILKNVRKTRSHYRYEEYKNSPERAKEIEKLNNNIDKFKNRLLKMYGSTRSAKIIFKNHKNMNIDIKDNMTKIREKVADDFIKSITDEVIYTSNKKITGYAFKNHSEDKIIKETLSKIHKMMKRDKFAPENSYILRDFLFRSLIYEKYHGEEAEYDTKTHKADEYFWKDVAFKLERFYKDLLKNQKSIDDMEDTGFDDIIKNMLKKRRKKNKK